MQKDTLSEFRWLFASEAKGIQNYILRTDRLLHIIGASETVSELTGAFLGRVLQACGFLAEDYKEVMTAAGRVMILCKDGAKLERLMAVWPLMVEDFAPGLEIVYDKVEVDGGNFQLAIEKAFKILQSRRQMPVCSLPVPGPLVERCRRDGQAAVSVCKKDGPVSAEIRSKIKMSRQSRNTLQSRFSPDDFALNEAKWPKEFEEVAGKNEKAYLAIVHADVNGMGEFFTSLKKQLETRSFEEQLDVTREVSTAIDNAAHKSAQAAVETLVINNKFKIDKNFIVPLRPLVLAGDDLTLVIRAPFAVAFVKDYIQSFVSLTNEYINSIFTKRGLKTFKGFTLSAGIAFTRCKFPFKAAYELCESLCSSGKEKSCRKVSTISFYRQTTTASDDLKALRDREFLVKDGNQTLNLTMGSYGVSVESASGLARIDDLEDIVSVMTELPRGALRGLVSQFHTGKIQADKAWNRFAEIAGERNPEQLKRLRRALTSCTANTNEPLWRQEQDADTFTTPMFDAVELHSVGTRTEDEAEENNPGGID